MANGRPGDSVHHDIVDLGIETFGPEVDALVREVDARIPEARRAEFRELIERWPWEKDGTPARLDELRERLAAMRDSSPPAAPMPAAAAAPPPKPRDPQAAALGGAVLGLLVGVPLGLVLWFIAVTIVLPEPLTRSNELVWVFVVVVGGGAAFLAARHGARPGRGGRAVVAGLVGFLLGGLVFGIGGGMLVLMLGGAMGVSQREGAFAMGVVFGLVPLLGLVGGLGFGAWRALRAWRRGP